MTSLDTVEFLQEKCSYFLQSNEPNVISNNGFLEFALVWYGFINNFFGLGVFVKYLIWETDNFREEVRRFY